MRLFGPSSHTKSKSPHKSSGPLFYRLPTYFQQVIRQVLIVTCPFIDIPPPLSPEATQSTESIEQADEPTDLIAQEDNLDDLSYSILANGGDRVLSKEEIYQKVRDNLTRKVHSTTATSSTQSQQSTLPPPTISSSSTAAGELEANKEEEKPNVFNPTSWYESYIKPFASTVFNAAINPFHTSPPPPTPSSSNSNADDKIISSQATAPTEHTIALAQHPNLDSDQSIHISTPPQQLQQQPRPPLLSNEPETLHPASIFAGVTKMFDEIFFD
jgi:hypothetical protein